MIACVSSTLYSQYPCARQQQTQAQGTQSNATQAHRPAHAARHCAGAEMGDAFKLLCFGVQFDKKRFATDITLFEGKKSKPAEVFPFFSLLAPSSSFLHLHFNSRAMVVEQQTKGSKKMIQNTKNNNHTKRRVKQRLVLLNV